MDERVFRIKSGEPVPSWDLAHRLPISGHVGPECKDSATVYKVNSTYMDVSEQPHMMRQWLAGAIQVAAVFSLMFFAFSIAMMAGYFPLIKGFSLYFITSLGMIPSAGFAYFASKFGRDEMFSLTRRPIRFNRAEKKIYAVRHRRFFFSANEGDITWEIPWNEDAFFCIHRGPQNSEHEDSYHIRWYEIDKDGNVVKGFAIGREWQDLDGMNDLLCQWNYWCQYMNDGPSELPQPLLFLTEKENLFESFLYCMYEVGFGWSAKARIPFLPFFCWMTIHRVASMWTCRLPVWPAEIEKVSVVSDKDVYRQPSGETPIGWAQTSQAHLTGAYPLDPRRPTPHWRGETDGLKNAARWAGSVAPGN